MKYRHIKCEKCHKGRKKVDLGIYEIENFRSVDIDMNYMGWFNDRLILCAECADELRLHPWVTKIIKLYG